MRTSTFSGTAAALLLSASAAYAAPLYTIIDLGVLPGDSFSQGNAISPGTNIATGRSLGSTARAFSWSQGGGTVALPNLAGRNFSVGNGVNNAGIIVGTAATTSFGSSPLPVVWQNGVISQLPLPAGETVGRAQDINNNGLAVGSVNGGSLQRAAIYQGGTGTTITTTTPGGAFSNTFFGVNDAGLAVGTGIDPNNAARNVGFVYDATNNTATEVGALPGANGALCFAVSDGGHVVGSSMLNQGSGLPFIWTLDSGIQEIPLPVGTSQGSARGVNASGWAVGTASSAFAIPFLFDGTQTYRVADLIPGGTGWDLSTNTSSSALGISDNGTIVGTGVLNGVVHAYAMVPVPTPGAAGLVTILGAFTAARRRR